MSHSFKLIVVKLSLVPHARINSSDKVYQASIASLKLHRFNIFIHHCRDSFASAIIRDDPFQPKSINPGGAHQPDGGLSAEANYTLLLDNGWCVRDRLASPRRVHGLSSVPPLGGAGSQAPAGAAHLSPISSSVVDLRALPAAPHPWIVTHLQSGTRLTSSGSSLWF